MADQCTYCGGSPVRMWQGAAAVCGSEACRQQHLYATHTPHFLLRCGPSPAECALAAAKWPVFAALSRVVPARWLIDAGGWRERLAVWVHGGAYWEYARMRGWA